MGLLQIYLMALPVCYNKLRVRILVPGLVYHIEEMKRDLQEDIAPALIEARL